MTDLLKLFCLVDGESTSNAFPLSASPADHIGTIKKLIKSEKTPRFDDIAPDELILWHVSIPVAEDNKDVPVLLESLTDRKKLLPTKRLSTVFSEGVSEDTVHIIVQRPPQASNTSPSLSSPPLQQSLPRTPLSGNLSKRYSISDMPVNTVSSETLLLQPNRPPIEQKAPKSRPTFREIVKLASKKAQEFEIEQRSISSVTPEIQTQLRASSNVYSSFIQAVKDGQVEQADRLSKEFNECFQRLETEMSKNTELTTQMVQLQATLNAKQDEMKQLQIQALGQLAVLQTRVQALLTQTYELHEYPIPRLFVVLPQDSSRWDILDPWRKKFRLYFMCECGEHTKSTNSKIPHHIHLAKHEGYEIARPTEFFQQYGTYVLTILKMLKFGISVAGVAIPSVSHLVSADIIDQVSDGLQQLKDHLEPGMDQVIGYIEKNLVDDGEAIKGVTEQMESSEALEGADLRGLETFLKDKDETKVLGNLYRTVTVEGHVKWVCIDHYRENYQATSTKALQNMVDAVRGSFNENIGRVEARLRSRVLAEQFYSVLEKARSVHELKINLDWEASYSDFKRLRDTLHKTRVAILDFSCGNGPAGDILNRGRRYNPIFQIMRHPSIQSFEIANVPKDFFQRTNELPKDLGLSNLRHLGFTNFYYDHPLDDVDTLAINTLVAGASHLSSLSLVTIMDFFKRSKPWPEGLVFPDLKYLDVGLVLTDEDINNLKLLVIRAPNLSLLSIDTTTERLPIVYMSISDVLTCTTDFKNKMRFSSPKNTSPYSLSTGRLQLFRDHGAQLESLNCREIPLSEYDVSILDEVTQNGSSLKELYCAGWAFCTPDGAIKGLAKIIARSELRLLHTALWKDDVRGCILQSIQWENLRELETAEGEEELKAFSEEISERVELGYLKHRMIPAEPVIKDTPETNPAIGTRTIKLHDMRSEGNAVMFYEYTITFTPGQPRPTVEQSSIEV